MLDYTKALAAGLAAAREAICREADRLARNESLARVARR